MTTVLVVDDSRVSRMMIKAIIADAQPEWRIIEAGSGDEAITNVTDKTPDIAFLDFNMPGMNGIELGEILKDKFPSAKLFLLTANIQESTQQKAAALNISFIGKPITDAKIRGAIDAHVG
jgi:two-component system, chemotaxis family, chemotaxis protein CheY